LVIKTSSRWRVSSGAATDQRLSAEKEVKEMLRQRELCERYADRPKANRPNLHDLRIALDPGRTIKRRLHEALTLRSLRIRHASSIETLESTNVAFDRFRGHVHAFVG
jgi:hypothetical protein